MPFIPVSLFVSAFFPVEIVPANVGCLSSLLVFSVIASQKSEVNLHSVKIIPLRADLALISEQLQGKYSLSPLYFISAFPLSTTFL